MKKQFLRTLAMWVGFLAATVAAGHAQKASEAVSQGTVKELQAKLAQQQHQIEQLNSALQEQQRTEILKEQASPASSAPATAAPAPGTPKLGEVASLNGMVPNAPAPFVSPAFATPAVQAPGEEPASPLQFRLGTATFTPVGFMDFTSISRPANAGSGIGSNFGSIPFGNTQAAALTETRLSPQNSRIGMRVDAKAKGANVLGYWESDFLGQLGNPPNGGLAVSSNPCVFRLRLFWVDVRKSRLYGYYGGIYIQRNTAVDANGTSLIG